MVGDCATGEGLDFAGVGGTGGSDSTDFCLDTPLFIGSFAFSSESVCSGNGSVTGWEGGAASVEVSSGDCVEGVTASLSVPICSLSIVAVRKKNSRAVCEYEDI